MEPKQITPELKAKIQKLDQFCKEIKLAFEPVIVNTRQAIGLADIAWFDTEVYDKPAAQTDAPEAPVATEEKTA